MGTFSGPQAKGARATARRSRREQAERRNALTPNARRRSYRDAQAKRQRRPAEPLPQPEPAAIACPWPWKDSHPDKASAAKHLTWLKHHDASYNTAEVYRCTAEPAHFHIGHARVPAERSRKERYRRDEEAA